MEKVLLHCCCAPCSISCIQPLRNEGIEPVAFWYNPNIHPFKEYEARRNCLIEYSKKVNMECIVKEDYGLRKFTKNVIKNIDGRCIYCYEHRLEETAKFARDNDFKSFTSTLLASIYQNHELMASLGEIFSKKYGVEFLYRDFRPNFRDGNKTAREEGLYMQKYCGCIFSEEERYSKQIKRDKENFDMKAEKP